MKQTKHFPWNLPDFCRPVLRPCLPVPKQDISVVPKWRPSSVHDHNNLYFTSQCILHWLSKELLVLKIIIQCDINPHLHWCPRFKKFPFNISISISIVCTTSNRRLSDLQSLSISFVHYSLYAWMQNQIRWMDRTVLQRTGMQASRYLRRQCLLWIDVFFLETICIARLGMKSLPHQLSYLAFLIYVHET